EFWKRWHISLSSWLQDYLYIPLGGNRGGSFGSYFFILLFMVLVTIMTGWWWVALVNVMILLYGYWYFRQSDQHKVVLFTYMNLMVTMLLGGLWHGASWAFVFWGFLHGFYLIVQRLAGPYWNRLLDTLRIPHLIQNGIAIAMVYFFTCLAWIYFRAANEPGNFEIANLMIERIASLEQFNFGSVINNFWVVKGILVIGILLAIEISNFRFNYVQLILRKPVFRVLSFAALLWLISFFGSFGSNSFIYFQFY
ncbi:MAG: hypothetical protein AAFO94_23040, partial [Bacteroidota bacterium]